MESLGLLVKRLREDRGLTQGQLATYAKVGRSWLSHLETDRFDKPERDKLERLASVLRIPAAQLLASAGHNVAPLPMRERTVEDALREALALVTHAAKEADARRVFEAESLPVYRVPLAEGTISGGAGVLPADTVAVSGPRVVSTTERGIVVRGDCMADEIRDGDTVIVDSEAECEPGQIVAALHEGEVLVKRLVVRDGLRYLVDNIGEHEYRANGETFIMGRVTRIVRTL